MTYKLWSIYNLIKQFSSVITIPRDLYICSNVIPVFNQFIIKFQLIYLYLVSFYKVIAYVLILWYQDLLVICFWLRLWRWLSLKTRNMFSTPEATDLLKIIMICINWLDIWIIRLSRFGFLVAKDISFFCLLLNNLAKIDRFCIWLGTY